LATACAKCAKERTYHREILRTHGLLRCYISRVENGHTVPAIETLEKMGRALGSASVSTFYDGEEPPKLPNLPKRKTADDIAWGSAGKMHGPFQVPTPMERVEESDRKLLIVWLRRWQRGGMTEVSCCLSTGFGTYGRLHTHVRRVARTFRPRR